MVRSITNSKNNYNKSSNCSSFSVKTGEHFILMSLGEIIGENRVKTQIISADLSLQLKK